jgi:hypothetical protein
VRAVVVADHVQIEPGRDILVDLLEELQEFLVAMQLADDGAVGHGELAVVSIGSTP